MGGVDRYPLPIIHAEPVSRGKPHESFPVLVNFLDFIGRETIRGTDDIKIKIKPPC